MSQPSDEATLELSCPNCGAPYRVPTFGTTVICAHCGSYFAIPASLRDDPSLPSENIAKTVVVSTTPLDQAQVKRWVRWLVVIIVVTTIVPLVCGVGAAVCGVLAPLAGFFFGR